MIYRCFIAFIPDLRRAMSRRAPLERKEEIMQRPNDIQSAAATLFVPRAKWRVSDYHRVADGSNYS